MERKKDGIKKGEGSLFWCKKEAVVGFKKGDLSEAKNGTVKGLLFIKRKWTLVKRNKGH